MKFYGTTTGGVASIPDDFYRGIEKIDGAFEIKVTAAKDIRTLQMNSLYWHWIGLLSEYSGYTKKELHSYFKTKLLCMEELVNGEKIIDCQSTTDLTIKEFGHYLQEVARLAVENFNYVLPDSPVLKNL